MDPDPASTVPATAVEINAGAWYLRALRADDRLSDVPALTDLGITDPAGYVAGTAEPAEPADPGDPGEPDAVRCVWAVCIPTTGELVALIGVTGRPGAGALRGCHRAGYAGALAAAADPVRRFAAQALDLPAGELRTGVP
ncbi:hypothetical protein MYK68_06575 [Gordonia sp. PP30]|uniref:hypothetical protein n=1 Tax=Gordonia sp. PP30 TaxID=2935861 RepID=UPI001FFF6EA3|nr:hypothetical protein [Gordonia sp. PP30]UQE76249.1 hypothetical protein MYK68_06575 [Gordonia sp. PP30]